MGHHASADVVYGVDLGNGEYGELYVTVPDEYEAVDLGEVIDELIDEYRTELYGPRPEKYEWEGGDPEEWKKWRAVLGGVAYDTYGYEYSGVIIIAGSGGHAGHEPGPLNLTEPDTEALEKFLQFLERKGFEFHPGKRKAQWLVTASYG